MNISSDHLAKLLIAWLWIAVAFLESTGEVRSQNALDQAHELLKEWSQAQQQALRQKPGEADLKRLRAITSSIAQEVPQLLNKGIMEFLNGPGKHAPDELSAKLTAVLQAFPPDQYVPEVFVFPLASEQQGSYLVAYNVPYCVSCSRAWIGLIGKKGGHYEILSEGGNSFDGKSLHVTPLPPGDDGNARFLVYGTNWGDAHSRLTVTAYSFADNQLKSAWSRKDLPQGAVKVTPTEITLSFLTSLTPPWNEKTEVYAILPESIQLRQTFERPNP
jgi:hypothetical protein